jgi:Secretion system C-terminal sorting domain
LFLLILFFLFGTSFQAYSQVTSPVQIPKNVLLIAPNGDGTIKSIRDIVMHEPLNIVMAGYSINDFYPTNAVNREINVGNDVFVPFSEAALQNISYTTGGEKLIQLKWREENAIGVLSPRSKILFNFTLKKPTTTYVKPDKTWLISAPSTAVWPIASLPQTTIDAAYPSNNPLNVDSDPNNSTVSMQNQLRGNTFGKILVSIKFGAGNNGRLRKPIIIVDGIDFDTYSTHISDPSLTDRTRYETSTIRYGSTGYDALLMGMDESKLDENDPNDRETFGQYPAFFSRLNAEGYDVVLVDFERGADYIQKNGIVLQEVIRRINREKQATAGGNCPNANVILGASMGGQVARWALRTMEINNEVHDCHTYLSFDSPQKGANIPLSVQSAAFFAELNNIRTGARLSLWQKLNTPAARQMISEHLGTELTNARLQESDWSFLIRTCNYGILRTSYITEMQNLGYPQRTRNVALACGSFQGRKQGFNANLGLNGYNGGDLYFNTTVDIGTFGFGRAFQFSMFASPGGVGSLKMSSVPCGYSCSGFSKFESSDPNTIFAGAFPVEFGSLCPNNPLIDKHPPCRYISAHVRKTAAGARFNFDNAPGGYRQDIVSLNKLIQSVVVARAAEYANDVSTGNLPTLENKAQCFISVFSAFDVQQPLTNDNMFQNFDVAINGNNLPTPFAEIFAPSGINLKHVEVNQDMIDFVIQQLPLGINTTASNLLSTVRAGEVYNFASNNRSVIPSVSIQNSGIVKVNAIGGSGYGTETNSNESTYDAYIGNFCGNAVFVSVESGGTLKIGENESRKGIVHILPNGVLQINSNGLTNIAPNAQIIVENGGKLILEAGANLTNNGKITVRNGGELIINGQPNLTGNGYIRFEKDHLLTMNTDWQISGTHPSQRMVQIAREASIIIPNSRTLTLENGLVEREAGSIGGTPNHIIVRKTANIRASYVTFDDYSIGSSRFIYLDGPEQQDFRFNNCTFLNSAIAVELKEPANTTIPREYGWGPTNQRVNVRFITCTFLNSNVIRAERAFIVELNNCTVIGGGIDISYAYWLDMHNITTIRGNSTGTAVKVKNVVHTELYDNSLIDKYNTGIDATESYNHNITMYDHASIQSCTVGINLNGGVNNPYGLDWGAIYMDCSRLLNNSTAIKGEDILFNMYARGGRTNMFTRPATAGATYFQTLFKCRRPTDIWLHGMYWNGVIPSNTNNNDSWFFWMQQTPCTSNAPLVPWNGTLHINEPNWWGGAVITNPSDPAITTCGGLVLRSPEPNQNQDLMAQKTIVFADGQYRDVKIQQDVALLRLRQQQLNTAEALFEPIARLSQQVRDTANAVVRHMIDVARVMAVGIENSTNGLSRNDHGWLPEATVSFDKTDSDASKVKLYPNPANDFFRLELKSGFDYEVQIYDAIGKRIESLDAKADLDLDTNDWKSGVYMIQVLNKNNLQRNYGKIVIQH